MKKGFTLLELLIATSIFAIVMLLTTATFTWASSYNSKLGEYRKTSLASKKAIEMISKDIRTANGKGIITINGLSLEIGQLTLLECDNKSSNYCSNAIVHNDYVESENKKHALLILQKDRNKIIIYRTVKNGSNYDFYRFEKSFDPTSSINITETIVNTKIWQKINHNIGMEITFWGYSGNKTVLKQQPYIFIGIIAQSQNYNALKAPFRAKIELQTAVTSRDYN